MEKVKYLARKLKTFTFEEMLILSEQNQNNLQIILDSLVKDKYLKQDDQGYIFIEEILKEQPKKVTTAKEKSNYGIFSCEACKTQELNFYNAVNQFLEQYVVKFCTPNTVRTYKSLFKNNIIPYFKDKEIESIQTIDIIGFYDCCTEKDMSTGRIKNALALLKQFLQYSKDNGFANKICEFKVKRLSAKNEFSLNRVIFEKGAQPCF